MNLRPRETHHQDPRCSQYSISAPIVSGLLLGAFVEVMSVTFDGYIEGRRPIEICNSHEIDDVASDRKLRMYKGAEFRDIMRLIMVDSP